MNDTAENKLLDQPFRVDIVEVEPLDTFQILDGLDTVPYSTQHTDESMAIHLRDGDATLVYTSDTGYDETLATFARKVDLLLMECSFVKEKWNEKHLNLEEAIHLIRMADPRNAMLTHFYDEWDEVNFAKEVRKFSPGCTVMEAADGVKVKV